MRTVTFLAAAVATVSLGTAHAAAKDPVDILIDSLLSKNVITQEHAEDIRKDIETARKEQAAEKSKAPVPATSKFPLKVSGYVQARYQSSEQAGFNDGFDVRRTRLVFDGNPLPNLDYRVQWDLAGSRRGVTAVNAGPPLTTTSADFSRAQLVDALVGYKLPSGQRIQVGQFKIPFSLENLQSSTRLDLINRSPVVESLGAGRDIGAWGRDIGIQFGGSSSDKKLEYQLGIFNGSGINVSDNNDRKDYAARLVFKPSEQWHIAAALYDGATGLARAAHDRHGLELLWDRGDWKFQGEYIAGKDAAVNKKGYYGTLVRKLGPRTYGALRYNYLDPNTGVGNNATSSWVVGLTQYISKDGSTRAQLNYEKRDEQGANINDNFLIGQLQAAF